MFFFQEVIHAIETLQLLGIMALMGIAVGTVVWIVGVWCIIGICTSSAWIIDHLWDFGLGAIRILEITSQSMCDEITSLITDPKRSIYKRIAITFWVLLCGWSSLLFFASLGVTKISPPFVIAGIVLSVPTSVTLWVVFLLLDGGKRPRLAHLPTVMRIAITWVAPLMAGIPFFRLS